MLKYNSAILNFCVWFLFPTLTLQLCLKHDTARVVQSCLKRGNAEQRTLVFTELKGELGPGNVGVLCLAVWVC